MAENETIVRINSLKNPRCECGYIFWEGIKLIREKEVLMPTDTVLKPFNEYDPYKCPDCGKIIKDVIVSDL